MHLRAFALSIVFIGALGLSSRAHADSLMWDWSYETIVDETDSFTGSGTFTTESTTTTFDGFTGYLITGITGNMNGETITGISSPGTFGQNDNLVAASGTQLDDNGFTFVTSTGSLYNPYYESASSIYSCGAEDSEEVFLGEDYSGAFTASITSGTPVPEPSQYGLGIFLAAAGFIAWRRFKIRAA